jgi:two-component system, chemotaxis family, protein-glutamate methylesterase/glutaminase
MMERMTSSKATMIGCPGCAGVLQAQVGPHGHQQFICSVGHAYSKESLYQAKEEELEKALWSAIALLAHLGMVLHLFEGQATMPDEESQRRLQQIERHSAKLRAIIEETSLLSTERSS